MWREIVANASRFDSAVLTFLDGGGVPYSLRCRVVVNYPNQALHIDPQTAAPLKAGSACLLWHRHDERLWGLLSFVVRGRLQLDPEGWVLIPQQYTPGMGIDGLVSYWRLLKNGRRTTRLYLEKRGLPRPKIAWDEWRALFEEVRSSHNDEQA